MSNVWIYFFSRAGIVIYVFLGILKVYKSIPVLNRKVISFLIDKLNICVVVVNCELIRYLFLNGSWLNLTIQQCNIIRHAVHVQNILLKVYLSLIQKFM